MLEPKPQASRAKPETSPGCRGQGETEKRGRQSRLAGGGFKKQGAYTGGLW